MASSLFSFVLVVFLFVNLSCATDLITSVCTITGNPPLCFQALRSDPRSAKADLKGLGQISLDISQTNVKQTLDFVIALSKKERDPKLKGRYDTCVETYGNANDDINNARQALNSGDIPTYRIKASAAFDGPGTCDDSFEGPPPAPPQLQQANKKAEGLISISLAVGAKLQGGSK